MEQAALDTLRSGIARVLLNRRNSASQTVLQGEMRAKLGAQAYSEALRQRWLVPDLDSGHLQITNEHRALETMRTLVEAAGPPASVGDQVLVADEGQSYQGTVAAINPDGSYQISFGANKPRAVRSYQGSEVRKVAGATIQPTPGAAPVPAPAPGTPPATGTPAPAVAPGTPR